ncbi:hypothetical protein B0F90DRAFT_1669624 [Multifurca ochricompacta]|uniref:Uncharacterized protein n=1 Tax=Multifurca ochricompacta TaxID=376703 RepID=A0AAD4QLQ4_9AGAM|nr:hypothetical protein B0F90DRAFT_1669624 [Multifurca ochricompacta]
MTDQGKNKCLEKEEKKNHTSSRSDGIKEKKGRTCSLADYCLRAQDGFLSRSYVKDMASGVEPAAVVAFAVGANPLHYTIHAHSTNDSEAINRRDENGKQPAAYVALGVNATFWPVKKQHHNQEDDASCLSFGPGVPSLDVPRLCEMKDACCCASQGR